MGCCNYTSFLNHFKTLSLTPSYLTLWHSANILEGRTVVVQAALFGAARKQHKAALGGARISLSTLVLILLQTTFICLSIYLLSRQQGTTGVLTLPGPKIALYLISLYRQMTTSTREHRLAYVLTAQCILLLSQKWSNSCLGLHGTLFLQCSLKNFLFLLCCGNCWPSPNAFWTQTGYLYWPIMAILK